METLITVGQDVLLVVAGLALRFLVAVLGFAALLIPIVAIVVGWDKVRSLRDRAAGLGEAGHVKWLRDASYAPWHTWLAPAGAGLARVGIDAVAEQVLGKVASIEIAGPGTQLRAGDTVARVVCGDQQATLRAPAEAMVVAINDDVEQSPDLLHREPYRRGWLALVAPTPGVSPKLRTGDAARAWLADEEHRLQVSLECALGFAAADGGDLVAPAHRLLAPGTWDDIVRDFLETEGSAARPS
jgi:glycine cleavage system H lipoate-binding protein